VVAISLFGNLAVRLGFPRDHGIRFECGSLP